ncbi:MAG: LbtU family siderophore porin [Kiritimatiellae bacterium]|nr:LbtU family siderophore porin [Kiritimatiellia bacterium]
MSKRYRCRVLRVGLVSSFLWVVSSMAQEDHTHLYHSPAEKRDVAGIALLEGVSVGGLLEVEAFSGEDGGEDVSDVVLATFELGVAVEFEEWIRGEALLLWEEDDTEPVDLDQAMITVGATEAYPWFVTVGKMYVPFGEFATHFVSDPLVLELGETRESAAMVGYEHAIGGVRFAAFNGDVSEDSDEADDVVVLLTFHPVDALSVSACWISSLGESDVLEAQLLDIRDAAGDGAVMGDDVSAFGGFASLHWKSIYIDVEYIGATEAFAAGMLSEEAQEPKAWNAEFAVDIESHELELAIKVEGSDEFIGFPDEQYGVALSRRLTDAASLSVEYLHGEFDDEVFDRDMVTAQLALEF